MLDASVFVAAISPAERHHPAALRLLERVPRDEAFLVPAVFRLEVQAALSRRGEPSERLDLVDVRLRGPRFRVVPVDGSLLERAVAVARTGRIRGYDALYVAVAVEHAVPLLTLDLELVDRLATAVPGLPVMSA